MSFSSFHISTTGDKANPSKGFKRLILWCAMLFFNVLYSIGMTKGCWFLDSSSSSKFRWNWKRYNISLVINSILNSCFSGNCSIPTFPLPCSKKCRPWLDNSAICKGIRRLYLLLGKLGIDCFLTAETEVETVEKRDMIRWQVVTSFGTPFESIWIRIDSS